jgi:hypothetical protein
MASTENKTNRTGNRGQTTFNLQTAWRRAAPEKPAGYAKHNENDWIAVSEMKNVVCPRLMRFQLNFDARQARR